MVKKKLLYNDDNINILAVFKEIYKKKFLIFLVSLLFMTAGYVYSVLEPQKYKLTILIKKPPFYLFEFEDHSLDRFKKTIDFQNSIRTKNNFFVQFNYDYAVLMLSADNLVRFVQQNNKNKELIFYLKNKNINISNFFQIEHDLEKPIIDENIYRYTLFYKGFSVYDNFLNDYIFFTKQEAEKILEKTLVKKFTNEIEELNQLSVIAKKLNIQDPNLVFNFSQDYAQIFDRNPDLLNYQIELLNRQLKKVKNLTLDYNPVAAKSSPVLVSASRLKLTVIFFLVGFFFAISIIFIKVSLINRY